MENEAKAAKFQSILESRGVTRRDFMKLCATIAAAAGVSQLTVSRVAQAIEDSVIGATEGNLYPVIWMEGESCTGCTEAFAQSVLPNAVTVILELISLNYAETLTAAAGYSTEEAKKQTIEAGNFILVYEGALAKGWNGNALRIAGETGLAGFEEAAPAANYVVALGSCAVNGGWMAAHPNPSQVLGVQQYMEEQGITTPVVNIPGCPANPEWFVSLLTDVVMMKTLPALNRMNKPTLIFGETVHDNCARRGHFENGEFVYRFGTEEEKRNYCLYALGCRGPQTYANCGIVRYNDRISWCIESGAPCIGCCEANPFDTHANWVEVNTPFIERNRDLRIGDWLPQPSTIAYGITAILAIALIIHGFGMKFQGRIGEHRVTEHVREWDAKHPDQSIGVYDDIRRTREVNAEDPLKKGGE